MTKPLTAMSLKEFKEEFSKMWLTFKSIYEYKGVINDDVCMVAYYSYYDKHYNEYLQKIIMSEYRLFSSAIKLMKILCMDKNIMTELAYRHVYNAIHDDSISAKMIMLPNFPKDDILGKDYLDDILKSID